jgi:hypothetical protein
MLASSEVVRCFVLLWQHSCALNELPDVNQLKLYRICLHCVVCNINLQCFSCKIILKFVEKFGKICRAKGLKKKISGSFYLKCSVSFLISKLFSNGINSSLEQDGITFVELHLWLRESEHLSKKVRKGKHETWKL